MRVRDVMTKELVTVEPETPIFQAQKLMREHQVRKLPVVMSGRLVGMVTHDLFMEVTPSRRPVSASRRCIIFSTR